MTDLTSGSQVPRIPLNVRLRKHRGQYLAIGYEHALELSPTAVFIWGQIDGTTDVDGIARAVSTEYAIDTETATEDVRALLDELAGHQLVVWDSSGPAR
ncbi:PqqD family protein [Streptomyces sp. NPDC005492]|uniref:PqqD family protein n=1 Tax=Streptomyces sp. NPDC005492 TaxID=3156883 RepID=UPI0033BB0A30